MLCARKNRSTGKVLYNNQDIDQYWGNSISLKVSLWTIRNPQAEYAGTGSAHLAEDMEAEVRLQGGDEGRRGVVGWSAHSAILLSAAIRRPSS